MTMIMGELGRTFNFWSIVIWCLLLLCGWSMPEDPILRISYKALSEPVKKVNDDKFPITDNSGRYYRTLVMDTDKKALYAGAAEHVYKLDLDHSDAFSQKSDDLKADPAKIADCEMQFGKSPDGHCRNHIQVIIPGENNTLYVCGSGAKDTAKTYHLDMTSLKINQGLEDYGGLRCSGKFDRNISVVLAERGNPGDYPALYSATDAIRRVPIMNGNVGEYPLAETLSRNEWLNGPNFVGSYHLKGHVYFWFREFKYKLSEFASVMFSRVARICVNDKGGDKKTSMKEKWTSYFKATLNCSIPGRSPYYFTEIQDIVKIDDKIYGTFTTPLGGPYASAICSFNQTEIEKVFRSGRFKEYVENSHWKLYEAREDPIPGQACPNDSFTAFKDPEEMLHRVLMYDAVQHEQQEPLFHVTGAYFRKIAVEPLEDHPGVNLLYLATADGKIYKVVTWMTDSGSTESHQLTIFEPDEQIDVWDMKLHGRYLFLAIETKVLRISTHQCKNYADCYSCARDPHCGWSNVYQTCVDYSQGSNLIQNIKGTDTSSCEWKKQKTVLLLGEMVHLPCDGRFGVTGPVEWYKDNDLQIIDYNKTFVTKLDGLVINDVQVEDQGEYTCKDLAGENLVRYNLIVENDACNDDKLKCAYLSGYRKWCEAFDDYQQRMHQWQNIAASCTKCIAGSGADNAHCNVVGQPQR